MKSDDAGYGVHVVEEVGLVAGSTGARHTLGDLIIPDRVTLTLDRGTTVHFRAPVGTDDNGRPELIVQSGGVLTVGTGVTFGTVDRDGARTASHGLRVETGGTATLNGVTIDEGEHRWSGQVTAGGDLIVGDGTNPATLRLEAGTEVRFAASDAASGGQDQSRSELIVENGGTLRAGAGDITFRSSTGASASNADWYGIRVAATGVADLSGATIRDGRRCLQFRGGSTVTLTNTTLTNCGLTVELTGTPPVLGGKITASLDPGDGSTLNEEFWQWQGRASAGPSAIPSWIPRSIAWPRPTRPHARRRDPQLGVAALAQTDPPEVVTVPDAALRRCFEASLGLCAGASIPATELSAPTVLEATDAASPIRQDWPRPPG